jgi:hypothetical protein
MGGNLFKLGRKPRAEYLEIEAEVRRCLDAIAGGGYRIPRYYASKADFGDLDVVLSRAAIDALGGMEAFRSAIAASLDVRESKSVGPMYSTVVRELQVDYFIRDPELLDATYHYLSFNDLGNLIGKIYRRLGFKYGEQGLCYVFRRTRQESYKRDLPISRDWPRILAFIGLDVPAWEAGFDTLEDMFAWASASPYFSVAPYQEQSRKTERRAAARTTMARFLAWLEAEHIDKRYVYLEDTDGYLPSIAAAFPEAELEQAIAHERSCEAEAEALREKFSGDRVREWTGLDGKSLGGFLRRFTREYSDDRLTGMTADEIRVAVESFPRDD